MSLGANSLSRCRALVGASIKREALLRPLPLPPVTSHHLLDHPLSLNVSHKIVKIPFTISDYFLFNLISLFLRMFYFIKSLSMFGIAAPEKKQRLPSAYNRFMRFNLRHILLHFQVMKFIAWIICKNCIIISSSFLKKKSIRDEIQRIKSANPEIPHREAFSAAAKNVRQKSLFVTSLVNQV